MKQITVDDAAVVWKNHQAKLDLLNAGSIHSFRFDVFKGKEIFRKTHDGCKRIMYQDLKYETSSGNLYLTPV